VPSFSDVLRSTGAQGERKGLEPYDKRIISLVDFKIEERGRGVDASGNPKEKRRVLTARVNAQNSPLFPDGSKLKPRRARMPVRYAHRFMEDMELRADSGEPYAVENVLVRVGEHGATLLDPNDVAESDGGLMVPAPSENGEKPKRAGRPRKVAPAVEPELAPV
jgi:hypothetical protein